MIGICGQVSLLGRVLSQVEEHLVAGAVAVQLVPAVEVHPPVGEHTEYTIPAPALGQPQTRHRLRVHVVGQFDTGERQHRRGDVPQFDQIVHDGGGVGPRHACQHRDSDRGLVERRLADQVVVAEVVAVVGRQDNDRVVVLPCGFQGLDYLPDFVVDLLDQSGVVLAYAAFGLLGEFRVVDAVPGPDVAGDVDLTKTA